MKTGPIVAIIEASIGLVCVAPHSSIYIQPYTTTMATINIEPKSSRLMRCVWRESMVDGAKNSAATVS